MQPPPVPLTGVVLAGGRSTRMGQDKALLALGGRRLIDIVVGALAPVCTSVIVAVGSRVIPDLSVRQVPDGGEHGPLGGIVSALPIATTALVAVVAVDMPAVDAGLLRTLADRWAGEVAVVPRAGGVLQPLHAVWATQWHPALQASLLAGERSATKVLQDLSATFVDIEDDAFARNLNRPSDLPVRAQRR